MNVLIERELNRVINNRGSFSTNLNVLGCNKLVYHSYNDFKLKDPSTKGIKLIRLIARHTGVAPVCKVNMDQEKVLEIWGEHSNVCRFKTIMSHLYDLIGDDEKAKKAAQGLPPYMAWNGKYLVKRLYWKCREAITEYLEAKSYTTTAAEYMYSLYLLVSKLRKLDKCQWVTTANQEISQAYFYTTKTFTVKRILKY